MTVQMAAQGEPLWSGLEGSLWVTPRVLTELWLCWTRCACKGKSWTVMTNREDVWRLWVRRRALEGMGGEEKWAEGALEKSPQIGWGQWELAHSWMRHCPVLGNVIPPFISLKNLQENQHHLLMMFFCYFFFFFNLATSDLSCNMQGSTSLTRDQTQAPLHWECRVLTTGPPGKSLIFATFLMWGINFKLCGVSGGHLTSPATHGLHW